MHEPVAIADACFLDQEHFLLYAIMQVRGAARVILIDNVADRLSFAQSKIPGLEIIDFNKVWQFVDPFICSVSAGIAQYSQ